MVKNPSGTQEEKKREKLYKRDKTFLIYIYKILQALLRSRVLEALLIASCILLVYLSYHSLSHRQTHHRMKQLDGCERQR